MSTTQLQLQKGDIVVLGNEHYEVSSRRDTGVEIASLAGAEPVFKNHAELKQLYFDRKMTIVRGSTRRLKEEVREALTVPLQSFSAEGRAIAMMRLDYVHMCEQLFDNKTVPRTLASYARIGRVVAWRRRKKAAAEAGRRSANLGLETFGASTIRDWYWRWRDAGRSVNALVPLDYMKGSKTPKMDANTLAVVGRHIREEWLTASRPPLTVVHENVVADIDSFNRGLQPDEDGNMPAPLAVPSLSTVSRWVRDNVDDYDAVLARLGKKEAERRFHGVRRAPQAVRPLQIVEVDHHLLDIQILDDTVPQGCRRPWLTVAICTTTRMIYGFHLGFEAPSWLSVMSCLKMGALPKDDLVEAGRQGPYPIAADWPVFGLPEILVVDNGKDFQSNSLKAAAGQLGFELRYTPTRRPHLKGKIERFFGEVARNFLAFLPGRTFASVAQKGDYDPVAKAALTLPELQSTFLIWALDYHHNKPHRGLMLRTPLQRWNELRGYGVRLPPSAGDLTAFLGMVIDRKIRSKGIEYLGLLYQSHELQLLRRRPDSFGRQWTVKIDPHDLSQISVLDEDGQKWLAIASTDPDLTQDLDIRMYREILDQARVQVAAGQRIHVAHLLDARRRLMEIGRAKGVARFSQPTEIDIDWFRENVDVPLVRVADRGADGAADPIDRQRRRGKAIRLTLKAKEAASADVVEAPRARLLQVEAPPMQPEDLSLGVPTQKRQTRRRRVDYDDPDTWR